MILRWFYEKLFDKYLSIQYIHRQFKTVYLLSNYLFLYFFVPDLLIQKLCDKLKVDSFERDQREKWKSSGTKYCFSAGQEHSLFGEREFLGGEVADIFFFSVAFLL